MKINRVVFGLMAFFVTACNEPTGKQVPSNTKVEVQKSELPEGASILQLDERLLNADSLVFVFYKDPHGKDSLRYTRYYKQYSTMDTLLISFLKTNLRARTERLDKIKKCRSEGKIWCFSKSNVFQTIYFSSLNSKCSFIYIIKNGLFYYSDISNELVHKLAMLKPKAIEPANGGQ